MCCILFILAVLGYIAVGILGKEHKHPEQLPVKILISITPLASFTFSSCAFSLDARRPQKGHLPHRQPRTVLWASWHPTGVSYFQWVHHRIAVTRHWMISKKVIFFVFNCLWWITHTVLSGQPEPGQTVWKEHFIRNTFSGNLFMSANLDESTLL